MSPEELLRKKIHMYDQCVIALGYDPVGKGLSEEAACLIEFLESECTYLRDGLQEHENGTHDLWAPFKEMLSADDPEAVAMRYRGAKVVERMQQRRRDLQRWSDIARHVGPTFPIEWDHTHDDKDDD